MTLIEKASYYHHRSFICNTKTNCFAVLKPILKTRRRHLNDTKTICFAVMMVYDAFAKRVIRYNKLSFNILKAFMMLLQFLY